MFCVSAAHWDFTEHKVSGKGVVVIDRYMRKRNAVDMLLSIGYYVPAFGLKICCSHKASVKHCSIAVQSLGRVLGSAGLLECL